MKSMILCAGEGRRASGCMDGMNKCLAVIPGFGRILDYSLNTAIELTDEIIVLLGYKSCDVRKYVENYVAEHSVANRILFAQQDERNGLCGGILCCEPLLEGEDFLLFLGDEILTEPTHKDMIADFREYLAFASCGFVYAQNQEDVKKTYSIELSGNIVTSLIEKPTQPTNNMVGTGNCVFRNSFCDYIRAYTKKNVESPQYSFPDVLKYAIDAGQMVSARKIGESYLNFNCKEDADRFVQLS